MTNLSDREQLKELRIKYESAICLMAENAKKLDRMSKSAGVESIEKFLGERIDFPPKPNYLFVHKIYPSSGVDRMYKQQEQIRELAQAIHDSIMGVK